MCVDGLVRDDDALTVDECRARCCLDPTCDIFQFDDAVRTGSRCCGPVCWRGQPASCDGPLLNNSWAYSARRISTPAAGAVQNNNATISEVPFLSGMDVAAISISGFVLVLVLVVAGCCCARRRSTRTVFPRPKEGLNAGDVVTYKETQRTHIPSATGDTVQPPKQEPKDESLSSDNNAEPTEEAPASKVLADGLDGQPTPRNLESRPPTSEQESRKQSILSLADVALLDDPYGGVWATVRKHPDGSPLRSPQEAPSRQLSLPDDEDEVEEVRRPSQVSLVLESDLVLESLALDDNDYGQMHQWNR